MSKICLHAKGKLEATVTVEGGKKEKKKKKEKRKKKKGRTRVEL